MMLPERRAQMLNFLKYDESGAKPAFRLRHPFVCCNDLGALGITLFFFSQTENPAVIAYLVAACLLYGASFLHHWIRHTSWGRTLDHTMIFVLLSSTALPLWGEHLWGWLLTGLIIVVGGAYKFYTFNVGGDSFKKSSSAIMYIAAAVPQIGYFLIDWYGAGLSSLWHWSWAAGSLLYLGQLGIYTKHWFDWLPEQFGYREVQHLILLCASTMHCITYVYLMP